jgi:PAS domain S-box-containing protein
MSKAVPVSIPSRDDSGSKRSRLLQVTRKVAGVIGRDFFQAMTKHLAEALAADCVLIAEWVGGHVERCKTIAAWLDGKPAEFQCELAESAAADVLLGKSCQLRSKARERFPSDTLFATVGAEACVAVPLIDGQGQSIGVLMAVFRRPMPSLRMPKDLLDTFAPRAAAELVRMQEDEKLRESEQRYRAFIARNADAMWRIEFDPPVPIDLPEQEQLNRIYESGYMAECNETAARLLHAERAEQLIGCRVAEIAPINDPHFRAETLVAIRAGYQLTNDETTLLDSEGNHRHYLRSQWGIVEDGKLERIWGANRDITRLTHTEMALDASEQRMADLLEAMRLVVILLDNDETIRYANHHLFQLTGWKPADLIGKNWFECMVAENERSMLRAEFVRAFSDPQKPIHFETTILGTNAGHWLLACDCTSLRDAHGETTARAIIGRDVTEYNALQEQLRQSQKLAGIGRMAGGVAHDFNNLLTVILGYTTGLLDKMSPSDPAYVSLSEVRKASEKGADLSRRLLLFGRRQVLRPKIASLKTVAEDAEPMIRALTGEGIQLVLNFPPDLGSVRIDAGYFHQVLLNLAANARDAMPNGGTLTIAASNQEFTAAHPGPPSVPPGSYVQLTVADSGMGIAPEIIDHIFEPFFTTKEPGKGTGLGLSMVYGIVKQSGGHILVHSEPGHGTAVRIYLPRIFADVTPEVPANRAVPRGSETILLVEGREDVRVVTQKVLQELGYTVLVADLPARALELCREETGPIHLLLTDIGLPQLRADELADFIKTIRPNIKVLFVSGYGTPDPSSRASGQGIAYLQKPYSPAELARKVREILD